MILLPRLGMSSLLMIVCHSHQHTLLNLIETNHVYASPWISRFETEDFFHSFQNLSNNRQMLHHDMMSKWKVLCTLSVAWDKTLQSKQTLFPVWGDKEDRKPRKGAPEPDQECTLRAT